jgi:hypothetical protein
MSNRSKRRKKREKEAMAKLKIADTLAKLTPAASGKHNPQEESAPTPQTKPETQKTKIGFLIGQAIGLLATFGIAVAGNRLSNGSRAWWIPACALCGFIFWRTIGLRRARWWLILLYGLIFFGTHKYIQFELTEADPKKVVPSAKKSKTNAAKYQLIPLRDWFKNDPNGYSVSQDMVISPGENNPDKTTNTVIARLIFDYDSRTKLLSFFIPQSPSDYKICLHLADSATNVIKEMQVGMEMRNRIPGDTEAMSSSNMIFSGRVFLYFEDDFTLEQQASIKRHYAERNLDAVLRGPAYETGRNLSSQLEFLNQNSAKTN